MSKHELIDAYVSGRIGRRDFMTRLTALGVSAGAATAYAFSLVPSASAAGARPTGRFVARAQDDADYGGPILGFPETVGEAIEAAISLLSRLDSALQEILDTFGAEDFNFAALTEAEIIAILQGFSTEINEQLSVLESTGSTSSGSAKSARPLAAVSLAQAADAEEALGRLAQRYSILDGYFAGAVPSLDDADVRLTLMGIALINAAQGAYIRTVLGEDPTPSTFIEPITLDDAEAQFDALDA